MRRIAAFVLLVGGCGGADASISGDPSGAPNGGSPATPGAPGPTAPAPNGGGGGGGGAHGPSLFVSSCMQGDISALCSSSLLALDTTPRAHAKKLPDVTVPLEPGGLPDL